jgi:hypothetical protein
MKDILNETYLDHDNKIYRWVVDVEKTQAYKLQNKKENILYVMA